MRYCVPRKTWKNSSSSIRKWKNEMNSSVLSQFCLKYIELISLRISTYWIILIVLWLHISMFCCYFYKYHCYESQHKEYQISYLLYCWKLLKDENRKVYFLCKCIMFSNDPEMKNHWHYPSLFTSSFWIFFIYVSLSINKQSSPCSWQQL